MREKRRREGTEGISLLGKTHSRISYRISKDLGVTQRRHQSLFAKGSTDPDSWAQFPHHYGKEHEIEENTLRARERFVSNDDSWLYYLGVALHYVQDKWTLRPRMSDKHTEWENRIEQASILEDAGFREYLKDAPLPSKAVNAYLRILEQAVPDETKTKRRSRILAEIKRLANFERPEDCKIEESKKSIDRRPFDFAKADSLFRAITDNTALSHARPMNYWSDPTIDLNLAYRMSLTLAHYVVAPVTHAKIPEETLEAPQEPKALQEKDEKIAEIERKIHEEEQEIDRQVKEVSASSLSKTDKLNKERIEIQKAALQVRKNIEVFEKEIKPKILHTIDEATTRMWETGLGLVLSILIVVVCLNSGNMYAIIGSSLFIILALLCLVLFSALRSEVQNQRDKLARMSGFLEKQPRQETLERRLAELEKEEKTLIQSSESEKLVLQERKKKLLEEYDARRMDAEEGIHHLRSEFDKKVKASTRRRETLFWSNAGLLRNEIGRSTYTRAPINRSSFQFF